MTSEREWPPSEFGGKQKANGFQPHPHRLTASEKLRSIYLTGNEFGLLPIDTEGVVFTGLLPAGVQRAIRSDAGDLEKGQVWQALVESDIEGE